MREYAFPILVAVLAIWAVYTIIRRHRNLSAAQEGEDMVQLKEAVAKALPNESGYQVICARYERSTHSGRTTTIYHYTYAVAFDALRMWVIPLGFEKDNIRFQTPILITGDQLGLVEVTEKRKRDQISRVNVKLRDKEGRSPLEFYADAQLLRVDRFHHFNISQQEELERFAGFICSFAQKVNSENVPLQERMADETLTLSGKRSKILGVLSILGCWTSLAGIILAGIGLVIAPKPKDTGGKPETGFILCCVGLTLSLLVPFVIRLLLF